DDCLLQVNLAIHRLEKKRGEKSLFPPGSNSAVLERRITALKYLRQLMETYSIRPTIALEKFSARNSMLYDALLKHDDRTVKEIKRIEEALVRQYGKATANHLFGKVNIDSQPDTSLGYRLEGNRLRPDQLDRIDRRIEQ